MGNGVHSDNDSLFGLTINCGKKIHNNGSGLPLFEI